MQRSIVIKKVNYLDPTDRLALLSVLDMYARDPMGGGEPLAADVKARLVGWPGLTNNLSVCSTPCKAIRPLRPGP